MRLRQWEGASFKFNPVNMLDLIRIRSRSAQKQWPEAGFLHTGLLLDQTHLAKTWQSAGTKSDLGWFCTLWSGTSVKEYNRVWQWEIGSGLVASSQKLVLMIPAHQLASRPDAFDQTLTRPSRLDLDWFCKTWSMPSLEKWNWTICGKSDQDIQPVLAAHWLWKT